MRLIDADALGTANRPIGKIMMFGGEYVYTQTEIDSAPTVDAVPVRHGRWQGVSPFVDSLECSECRYCITDEEFKTPYCPYCGAKMDEAALGGGAEHV